MSSLSVFVLLKTRRDFRRQANSNVTKEINEGWRKHYVPKKKPSEDIEHIHSLSNNRIESRWRMAFFLQFKKKESQWLWVVSTFYLAFNKQREMGKIKASRSR